MQDDLAQRQTFVWNTTSWTGSHDRYQSVVIYERNTYTKTGQPALRAGIRMRVLKDR